MQKFISLIVLCFLSFYSTAQLKMETSNLERKGFSFGTAIGIGSLSLSSIDQKRTLLSASLPNFKLGYSLTNRFSLMILIPGATYKSENKVRGFEGVLLMGQYWFAKNWWINVGYGLTLDAPAFYTVSEIQEANFSIGFPAVTYGMGYDVFKRGRFSVDLQYRAFHGQTERTESNTINGFSNMFLVGLNWY